ncbi:type III restriction endonuclease subunit R, partial [Neisseria sp. P0017.S001]
PEFQAIWDKLKYKTRYRVCFDTEKLIEQASAAVAGLPEIQKPKIRIRKAQLKQSQTYGIETVEIASRSRDMETTWEIPDIL